ncbi:MAG: hypothetical protein ABJF04_07935 [Reichenbachiella sp.]|uniref:hypothetical protein n=1 Tax=Reichenbachiella sp. TaxID=2184521 RepID=UPI003262FF6E
MNHPVELESKDLQPIADLINLIYSGYPQDMKNDLHQIIYLLHYVDSQYINKPEIERAIFTLYELGEKLREIQERL